LTGSLLTSFQFTDPATIKKSNDPPIKLALVMKTFYFTIEAKGGAGKSMLTHLQALKNEDNIP
jgi:hypothetical protein